MGEEGQAVFVAAQNVEWRRMCVVVVLGDMPMLCLCSITSIDNDLPAAGEQSVIQDYSTSSHCFFRSSRESVYKEYIAPHLRREFVIVTKILGFSQRPVCAGEKTRCYRNLPRATCAVLPPRLALSAWIDQAS